MGNVEVIKEGEIQVMSAGAGVQHSEYNKNNDREINLLQLWIFPDKQNVTPRYAQQTIRDLYAQNDFFQILSPSAADQGVWIHQNSWFHMLYTDTSVEKQYRLKDPSNGVYCFVIEGAAQIENQTLEARDAMGVWETTSIFIKATTQTQLLLIEVPMTY
jgi:redox-sensitive bicupin YhaK (pirin superfamily)